MKATYHLQDYDVENQSFESKTKTKESSFVKILFSVCIICGFIIAFNLTDASGMQHRELLGGGILSFFVRMDGHPLIPVDLPATATVADLMRFPSFLEVSGSFTYQGRTMHSSELLADVGICQEAPVDFRHLPDMRKVSQITAWEALKWKPGTIVEFHGLSTSQTPQPGGTPSEVDSNRKATISGTKWTIIPGFSVDAKSDDGFQLSLVYRTEQGLDCLDALCQLEFIPLDKELTMVEVIHHEEYTPQEWAGIKAEYQEFLRDHDKDDTEPQ